MRRMEVLIGLVIAALILVPLPAATQQLRAVGQIRSSGPVTSEASKKIFQCQTNPSSGACLAAPTSSVTTQINANAAPTFGVFVVGTATVPFDPAKNRIFVRFKDAGAVTRGATSVAVRTQ